MNKFRSFLKFFVMLITSQTVFNSCCNKEKTLFWMRPPDRPGINGQNAPDLAIRKGDYKLLMDFDGSNLQLYNIISDESEINNLVNALPGVVDDLKKDLGEWYEFYPHLIDKAKIEY